MNYNDWIRTVSRGFGTDGYTEVEVKDMQGNWKKVARFDEADDWKFTNMQSFIHYTLCKGQPFRHATD